MSSLSDLPLEVVKSGLTLGVLLVAGRFTVSRWDRQKQRQELDIAATENFQELYGQLKEISRLWRSAKRQKPGAQLDIPSALRWDLLARATSAEGRYEALIVKLASERPLSENDIRTLGLFRQAVQMIRESLRADELPEMSEFGPAYLAFNDVAAEVVCLIGARHEYTNIDVALAKRNLQEIARVNSRSWAERVALFESTARELASAAIPSAAQGALQPPMSRVHANLDE